MHGTDRLKLTNKFPVAVVVDYGAGGCSPTEFPGATCNHVTLVTKGGQLLLESPTTHARKRVQRVVPLARLLLESTAPTIAVDASTLTLP